MTTSLDSISLFIKQVKQHAEILTDLLSNGLDHRQAQDLMERSIVSTGMLSGSTAIMGLSDWQDCLSAVESLISRYRNLSLPWDERIAQVISELIEKEETLVSAQEGGEIGDLNLIVSREELQALLAEVNVLLDAEPAVESVAPAVPETAAVPPAAAAGKADEPSLFPGCRASLKSSVDELFTQLNRLTADPAVRLEDVRRQLLLIDFYAQAMDNIIRSRPDLDSADVSCSLGAMETILRDVAAGLSAGRERRVQIDFTARELTIDAGLLTKVGQVLSWMVQGIFERNEEIDFEITVSASSVGGALKWELRDNGNNFISDSRFDHEEILAFYPSLKNVRRVLRRLSSVLWVEPEGQSTVRFAFTIPLEQSRQRFQVWGDGSSSFAVLSTQHCATLRQDEVELHSDALGDHLVIDGQRVPLIKLGLLFSDAPELGKAIAIVGALEKRFAFYVDGPGRVEAGSWLKDSVSTWKDHQRGVAQLEGGRVPLLEADDLMRKYLAATGDSGDEEISGGAMCDNEDLSRSQATLEKDSASPPETSSAADTLDVLVIERSSAVAEVFRGILGRTEYTIKVVDTVESALDILMNNQTRLIISEFRMPTMAAKVIADRTRAGGLDIPLLVTTSHSGANAQLLVEKLGVSGYLSKPLDEEVVFAKVNNYLHDGGAPA